MRTGTCFVVEYKVDKKYDVSFNDVFFNVANLQRFMRSQSFRDVLLQENNHQRIQSLDYFSVTECFIMWLLAS